MEILQVYDITYILLALIMAATSGILGSFAVMKRMTLASDPISHIALPGLGLALIFNIHPILGAASTLILGAILIWALESKTGISTEAITGVIFATALAAGSLLTPDEELIEALLGGYVNIPLNEFLIGVAVSLIIMISLLINRYKLTLSILSPELAKTSGVKTNLLNLYFLITFVATMLLGLRYLGVLLMGSLIIIPAVVGKNLGRSLSGMISIGVITAIASVSIGLFVSQIWQLNPGPNIILSASAIFLLSLFIKR